MGLSASPSFVVGQVGFTSDAESWHAHGKQTILVQNADVIEFFVLHHCSHF